MHRNDSGHMRVMVLLYADSWYLSVPGHDTSHEVYEEVFDVALGNKT